MDNNEVVTVVNRSSRLVTGTRNGRQYDIPPYPGRISVPRNVARAIRFQNPVMGLGTPNEDWSSKSEYLVGIVEDDDPVDPKEQSTAPQRWDTYLVNGPNTQFVRPRGGYEEVKQAPQVHSETGGFVKP